MIGGSIWLFRFYYLDSLFLSRLRYFVSSGPPILEEVMENNRISVGDISGKIRCLLTIVTSCLNSLILNVA